jgi:hypothetical protein
MSDPNLTTRVNGVPYSWTSCAHFYAGIPYKGVTKVDWKESRKRVYVPNAQQDGTPQGITSGIYRVDSLSFTLLRDSADGLRNDLGTLGAGSFGDAQFDYMLQLYEPANQIPSTTLISGCVIEEVGETQEFAEDGGYLVTELTCKALFVLKTVNGNPQQLWSQLRSLL